MVVRFFSLVTIGYFMNATTFNQGNHCIVLYNQLASPVDVGNENLLERLSGQQLCQELQISIRPYIESLAAQFFGQLELM
jgi:hypothetical protein